MRGPWRLLKLPVLATVFTLAAVIFLAVASPGGLTPRRVEALLLAGGTAAFFLAVLAVTRILWRWGETAIWMSAAGAILLAVFVGMIASGSRVSLAGAAYTLGVGTALVAVGWLMRRFGARLDFKTREVGATGSPWVLATPSWLGPRLDLVYHRTDGLRITYLLTRTTEGCRVRMRDEEDLEFKAKHAEALRAQRQANPRYWTESDEEELRELSIEWEEFDLADDYGDFLIDWSMETKELVRHDASGRDHVSVAGARYRSTWFDSETESDCGCAEMARYKMFWIGPGRCWRCAGILSRLRRCKECGGTGKCDSCAGDGKVRWRVRTWFEVNTGLLLRRESWRNGAPKPLVELETANPDVLAPFAVT